MALSMAPLQNLVELLQAGGLRATLDPASVNLPGAWVTLEGFQAANLARDHRLLAVVWLLVPDTDARRALEALADLFNQVVPSILVPDGQVNVQGVQLPDTTTVVPGLRVPVHLFTQPTEE